MVIERICCIGAGYVGGLSCSVMALKCPDIKVTICDKNVELINQWNSEKLPFYEPGLDEIVKKCRGRNLYFSIDIETGILEADLIFISLKIPTKTIGECKGRAADIKNVEEAARMIADISKSNKIVVEKSSIAVKTAEIIMQILQANSTPGIEYQILSNPEFIARGSAITDLLEADRVLIGGENTPAGREAVKELSWVYQHWIPAANILTTDTWSSQLSKLAASALLAQRISSVNSLSALCETVGADVSDVARVVGKDSRIGPKFLKASLGFSGSSLQKHILSLIYLCECLNLPEVAAYWQQVIDINDYQKSRFTRNVIEGLSNTVACKNIAILGFSFKQNTADICESTAIYVAKTLLEEGAKLHIYDSLVEADEILNELLHPAATCESETLRKKYIEIHNTAYSAVQDTHAIILCTEWDEWKKLDYKMVFDCMMKPAYIFDGGKSLNHDELVSIGFQVQTIGKKDVRAWKGSIKGQ